MAFFLPPPSGRASYLNTPRPPPSLLPPPSCTIMPSPQYNTTPFPPSPPFHTTAATPRHSSLLTPSHHHFHYTPPLTQPLCSLTLQSGGEGKENGKCGVGVLQAHGEGGGGGGKEVRKRREKRGGACGRKEYLEKGEGGGERETCETARTVRKRDCSLPNTDGRRRGWGDGGRGGGGEDI